MLIVHNSYRTCNTWHRKQVYWNTTQTLMPSMYTLYLQYIQSNRGVAAVAKQMLCTKCTIVVFVLVENPNPFLQKSECIVKIVLTQ